MDTSNNKNETFKSHQILAAVSVNIPSSQASVYRKINNLITSGVITRTARNTYILSHNNLKLYDFDFSNLAKNIISIINKNFVNL
ncbi:MAG: hypothetical protein HUK24_03145, partial [Sphaerochaetaceae bacterium]|nr:hypothetical protein [Sphaerochaetaceae bacterium]